MKVLVVYYSFSGVTKKFAEEMASNIGAELRELVPETKYSFVENAALKALRGEIENGHCPKLERGLDSIADYDLVFVGSPNWIQTFAPPVRTFLRNSDLSGKIIVPFCTHGGGGIGRMVEDVKKECPHSDVREGIALKAGEAFKDFERLRTFLSE